MTEQEDLPAKLTRLAFDLMRLAQEYRQLKFSAGEQAMKWPLAVVDDDGEVGLWCAKDDCSLDGHNSKIYLSDLSNFTMAQVLYALIDHIDADLERRGEQTEPPTR